MLNITIVGHLLNAHGDACLRIKASQLKRQTSLSYAGY